MDRNQLYIIQERNAIMSDLGLTEEQAKRTHAIAAYIAAGLAPRGSSSIVLDRRLRNIMTEIRTASQQEILMPEFAGFGIVVSADAVQQQIRKICDTYWLPPNISNVMMTLIILNVASLAWVDELDASKVLSVFLDTMYKDKDILGGYDARNN